MTSLFTAARLVGRTLAAPFSARSAKPPAAAMPDLSDSAPRDHFTAFTAALGPGASVLEVGTKQSVPGVSTHSKGWCPGVLRENYVMADVAPGGDVDVVANLHALPEAWANRFDAFIANAVFEHLERPWVAAKEVARLLAPGGACYVGTHQTFPLHGYPSDFFRFSTEALALIFRDAGLEVVAAAYEHRAKIIAPPSIVPPFFSDEWNATWPSYIAVHVMARKAA